MRRVQSCLCAAGPSRWLHPYQENKVETRQRNHITDYSELIEEVIAALLAVLRSRPHLMVLSSAILSAMHHGLLLLRLRMPKMGCWD